MSKFDYEAFYGDYNYLGISKEKYTKEEAIAIAREEFGVTVDVEGFLAVHDAFSRHRAGVDDYGERHVGWWLEFEDAGRNCPIWCFRFVPTDKLQIDKKIEPGWEYIPIQAAVKHSCGECHWMHTFADSEGRQIAFCVFTESPSYLQEVGECTEDCELDDHAEKLWQEEHSVQY